ncbi:MAG: hypothetical protein JXJ04_21700 [Spirochaetales bacterium]|nr:hypothetical protein [Spirochaetales bacterium]
MEIIKRDISEEEFYKLNYPILFENGKYNKRFGVLTIQNDNYAFAWRSELIEPVILKANSYTVCVGVDQNCTLIDVNKKLIERFNLLYNLFDIKLFNDIILIITELEIISVHTIDFKKSNSHPLPDLFEEIIIDNKQITVKCSENTSTVIHF